MAEDASTLAISSVEDGVYRILREEIGRLALAPGDRLRLEELARRFDVSLTPVRHALRRLESEGLVVSIPRRGSRVASLSVEELEETAKLVLLLRGLGPRLLSPAEIDDLVATFGLDPALLEGDLE